MSLALLNRNPVTWDSEAASYLTSVETADAQSLEPAVSRAINTFVIDCKVRGIWGSIKSSCLLCGPRTLNGALVPLKGTAPTNNNFVSSDYNRETGLKGDGSSKYIDTNRNYSTDPQNNQHMCVYISSFDTKPQASGSTAYIGSGTSTGGGIIGKDGSNNRIYFRHQNITTYTTGLDVSTVTGLLGSYRNNSSDYTIRINGKNLLYSQSSQAPLNANIFLFAIPGPLFYTNGRLSFYSIGEALDLRLLEQCVERFNSSLRNALYPTSINAEALNWIRLSEGYNNVKISATTAKALSDFCNSIESANLRNKFYRLNLFCGPTLGTALVPLYKGPSFSGTQFGNFFETSFNFTDSSYSELGLLGNGTSSYLDPGILTSTMNSLYPNIHFAVYGNNSPTANKSFILTGSGSGGSNYALVGPWTTTQWVHHIAGEWNNGGIFENIVSRFGMKIISRTATNLVKLYSNGSYVDQSTTTVSSSPPAIPATQTIKLFANQIQSSSPSSFIDLRSCGYSMGAGMTDSEASAYYTIMQTFQTALGRQV